MQDGVLNLCRVKLRDQQRLAHGPLNEYTQFGRGHPVRRSRAARRQRLRRRPARRHPEVQGLGDRSQRLHLLHHPGAGVGEDLRPDRRARLEDPSRLRQAAGPPAAAQGDLRAHRAVDHDQDQVRGHERSATPFDIPVRPDPVDEGTGRGAVAARTPAPSSRSITRRAASTCRSATRSSSPTASPR